VVVGAVQAYQHVGSAPQAPPEKSKKKLHLNPSTQLSKAGGVPVSLPQLWRTAQEAAQKL